MIKIGLQIGYSCDRIELIHHEARIFRMPMPAPPPSSGGLLTYCQFLLNSQINYTLTYLGDHTVGVSHDQMNNLLDWKLFPSSLLWENTKDKIIPDVNGYTVIDDTVLDKRHSRKMD